MKIFDNVSIVNFFSDRGFNGYKPIVISEDATDTIEVTEHPIENGSYINDHVIKRPTILTCEYIFYNSIFSTKDLQDIYNDILEFQKTYQLVTVNTGKRIHENMLIKSVKNRTDAENENILTLLIDFQRVNLTTLQNVTVASQSANKKSGSTINKGRNNPQGVGSKATEQGGKATAEQNTSSLYDLASIF